MSKSKIKHYRAAGQVGGQEAEKGYGRPRLKWNSMSADQRERHMAQKLADEQAVYPASHPPLTKSVS